jgi:hypothetical protein
MMSSSGGISVSIDPVNAIKPAATWKFTLCPAVSAATCASTTIAVNASGSLSSQLSAIAVAPRISGGVGSYAYADTEVAATPNNTYFQWNNLTACRYFGSSWGGCGGGAGGAVLPTNAVVYGITSTTSRAATGTDLNGLISGLSGCSTSGNFYNPAGTDCVAGTGFANPMTTQGDLILQGSSGPTRLPANANPGQGLLVSTAAASTVAPTTKHCAIEGGSTGNSQTCTWNVAPVSGEFLVCSVFNASTSPTFTLSDSASNTYTAYGAVHDGTTTSQFTQTFYAGPISNSPTTETVSVGSSGSYLTIQCNSANNIAASSPTDGQQSVDVTGNPIQLSTPITTTVGGDYIYCATAAYYASALSAGSGFTAGASPAQNYLNQYGTQAAAGAITPLMGSTVSNSATMTCSAFKAGSAVTPATTAWDQTVAITSIQADNTPVLPNPPYPSGGDDYANLQNAVNTAIAQGRELIIPGGIWNTSAGLVANSNSLRMRGNTANYGAGPSGGTMITATGNGYNTFSVGTGSITAQNPSGYIRDMTFQGNGKPALGSPTGVSCLQINALVQFDIENVGVQNCDIGLDDVNNSFGAAWHNIRGCFGGSCNAGIYIREGEQSGSDLSFYDMWVGGQFCGVCIAGGGGGYHFYSGQINAGEGLSSPNDGAGAFVLNYDYLTGSTGSSSYEDVHNVSFEGTTYAWAYRSYGASYLTSDDVSINPTAYNTGPAIGVFKGTGLSTSRLYFNHTNLSGYFSSPVLMSLAGSTQAGPYITETATQSSQQNPTINGTYTYVDNMTYQSGVQSVASGTDGVGVFSAGIWISNNGGVPQYSSNHGSTWTNFYVNPLTNLGDIAYGGFGGAPTRLAGNTTAAQEVLVSQGGSGLTPTTRTCAAQHSGGGNSQSCTWSTSPQAGEYVVVGVYSSFTSGTFAVTDSAGNTYNAIGSVFSSAHQTAQTQTFWFGPLAAPITTLTVNSTTFNGNYLALQAQTVTDIAASPLDGQCTADTAAPPYTCSSAITTTANGDYLFCANYGFGTLTVGAGFTAGSSFASNGLNQYQVQATAGAITPTMGGTASNQGQMTCTAFKAGAAAAAAPFLSNAPALSAANMTSFPSTLATSGANSNITSLTGLTTPLSTAQGGTGAGVLTGIRRANGASADTAATSAQLQSAIGGGVYAAASVSGAISSATAGSGISAVTCTTATCTNLRGTYTMTATAVSAGATILTLVWPTTTTAYACLVSQDGGTLAIAPSHSVATATGMTISSDLAITSGSVGIDYACQP